MSQPVAERSPVPGIIAAELQTTARGHGGGWSGQIRTWPGKVVPGNDRQVTAAVLTLIGNARWPRDQARELTALFAPLYRAGWCNEAIVRMLDSDPDGTRRPPWLVDHETPTIGPLTIYLNRRLHAWIPADPADPDDTRDITRAPAVLRPAGCGHHVPGVGRTHAPRLWRRRAPRTGHTRIWECRTCQAARPR
ncbi:hypothetical protein DL991_10525 [Amycolatopsis sp. WAC 01375]|uniref:hypothetical protein n=1 Tax=Amycolatopsis sp. WAC 01375 TaxID=2203194 RepID=UPI000F7992B3|nr:hypothetical protein [Amycolatopsis sp. WAC 01375]RSM80542.1 hypothetical protein DL991_10525 [Amycolatopsis sp. WAC 01375]